MNRTQPRLRSLWPTLNVILWALTLLPAPTQSALMRAQAAEGRVWHVAPQKLDRIADSDQTRTIGEAASRVEAGDTVVIHTGVYRETVVVDRDGTAERPIRFLAAPGAHVVVTGSDSLAKWSPVPGRSGSYTTPWPHRFIGWNSSGTHPDDPEHLMIGRCEQVFVQGYPLLQVLSRDNLARGTFFVDLEAKQLLVSPRDGADLTRGATLVEASVRQLIWHSRGSFIQVRGLHFVHAANMAQQGAALFEGKSGVIEDCTFEWTNSTGATFTGTDIVVRRCAFQHNGQLGFGANRAHNLLMSRCVVRENNEKGFSRGWEAGGDKLALCRGVVLEDSQFLSNRGTGVWFDIGNEQCTVRRCLIADNEDAGIFYEISYGLQATDNVIVRNGFAATPGAWGAQAGIVLSSAPGCTIERNLIIGNREGFNFREQGRKTPRIDDSQEVWIYNHDQVVRHNVFAWNAETQVRGWFDVDDVRHWPAADPSRTPQNSDPSPPDQAARYRARDAAGAPTGLSLEKLNLRFEDNLYAIDTGQPLLIWGVDWRRREDFDSLDAVRSRLKLEDRSVLADPGFADLAALDLRIPDSSPATSLGCYPRGAVPGVVLGVVEPR